MVGATGHRAKMVIATNGCGRTATRHVADVTLTLVAAVAEVAAVALTLGQQLGAMVVSIAIVMMTNVLTGQERDTAPVKHSA